MDKEEKKQITEQISRVHQDLKTERAMPDASATRISELADELVGLYERYIALVSPH